MSGGKVVLRPAVAADFAALLDRPLPYRVRATSAEQDGRLLGIGGLAFLPTGVVGAFLVLAPGVRDRARAYAVPLHRAGRATMAAARGLNIRRVVAMAEPGVAPATAWLERLGFEARPVGDETVYVWEW